MKRFALKRFVAGDAGLAFLCQELSGITSGDLISSLVSPEIVEESMYFANTSGNFSSQTIYTDGMLIADRYLQREYSINNPLIVPGGTDLQMRPPAVPITDCTQFGNYAFYMTDETTSGTSFYLSGSISGDEIWCTVPHEIVTYVSGTLGTVDRIISSLTFEFSDSKVGLFGTSNDEIYVKSLSIPSLSSTAYGTTMCGTMSLPFTYMLEQPLNVRSIIIDNAFASAYGSLSAPSGFLYCQNVNISSPKIYSDFALINVDDIVLVNPFNLKNIYDPNWQTPIDREKNQLRGIRDYLRAGSAQETLWMSYRYIHEDVPIIQSYDLVERVKGFYKYKQCGGHKGRYHHTGRELQEDTADTGR